MNEMNGFGLTREDLEKRGIFELRVLARNMGVSSPTTLNKNELVDKMLSIMEGLEKPKKNNGRGRPPKDIFGLSKEIEAPAKKITSAPSLSTPFESIDSSSGRNFQMSQNYSEATSSAPIPDDKEPIDMLQGIDYTQCQERSGILEILSDGYGFLRAENCENSLKDTYVSTKIIKRMGLRMGDFVVCMAKINNHDKPAGLVQVLEVNGRKPETLSKRASFDSLIPIYPNHKIKLETENGKTDFAIRCIDLISPIGKGQRGMIVSPPKAGKTTLLKKIANAITLNNPEIRLFVLLIDERPEEVTDMKRSINGEVVYSTFDEMPEHHTKAAELLLARAKRMVEYGEDVVILMDSLTRLARAYNMTIPPTGRTLSGGIDPGALHSPKRFFGSARNFENGGSLTIIATALVDTGSRMDEVIYEEFKGTGNMEIHLDRKLSEKRIFPAIDLNKSSTRREDLLLSQKEMAGIWNIRKMLSSGDNQEATENLISMLTKAENNQQFIEQINLSMTRLQKEGFMIK